MGQWHEKSLSNCHNFLPGCDSRRILTGNEWNVLGILCEIVPRWFGFGTKRIKGNMKLFPLKFSECFHSSFHLNHCFGMRSGPIHPNVTSRLILSSQPLLTSCIRHTYGLFKSGIVTIQHFLLVNVSSSILWDFRFELVFHIKNDVMALT